MGSHHPFGGGNFGEMKMGNTRETPKLMIDGVEYEVEKLTDQQKALLDHVVDLERKVASAKFNLDQLQVGRDTFFNMLKQSLVEQPVEAQEVQAE